MPLERHDPHRNRMRSSNFLQSMNIETTKLANEDDKKDLFDSQASPHSADTKAETAVMNKTIRETRRETMRGMDTMGGISSVRENSSPMKKRDSGSPTKNKENVSPSKIKEKLAAKQ